MDRALPKKFWTKQKIVSFGGGALLIAFVIYLMAFTDHRSKLNVDRDRVTIATIEEGPFQEWIPETGIVNPIKTYFLDAIEGGIVKQLDTETGTMVEKGEALVTLTNSELQLEVMNREAQLYEQINNLRTSRLLLEQNTQNLKSQLAEINYQLDLLKPKFTRSKHLNDAKVISDDAYEDVKEKYAYNLKRKDLIYDAYKRDSIVKQMQMQQLDQSEQRMWKSLEAVNNILDNLIVRAPKSGLYAAEQLEIGQSIDRGERLGQIDIVEDYKLKVAIDEVYLPRIKTGQTATYEDQSNNAFTLSITKIYPTIKEGSFSVDMEFKDKRPKGIKRGQSLRIRIELGNPGQAVLLPTGGFFQSTGGNWVYVLDKEENQATKQPIRLGRKNAEYYEVLEGLKPGDRIITSSYEYFGGNEVLNF